MTHKELKDRIKNLKIASHESALLAVVELHKPIKVDNGQIRGTKCFGCTDLLRLYYWNNYPCPTIQAIEKELE